jgi:hypothetical protein
MKKTIVKCQPQYMKCTIVGVNNGEDFEVLEEVKQIIHIIDSRLSREHFQVEM